jgi:D-amino-acid dehydrogenase
MRHIAVIGAGITGVTTAYALAQRGYAVTVFDRQLYPAMETSFANGGQISASNAEVWNSWPMILKGLKWMLRPDAPLLMNPLPGWHKYSWIAEFIGQIRHYRANTVATAKLAIQARRHLFAIAEREGIHFDLEKRGILHIYRDRASFTQAHRVTQMLAEGGLERQALGPDGIRKIEPALCGDYYGGFFTDSDATGDIHKFTRGLAAVCKRKGVRFIHGATVERFDHQPDGLGISWTGEAQDGARPGLQPSDGRCRRGLRRHRQPRPCRQAR